MYSFSVFFLIGCAAIIAQTSGEANNVLAKPRLDGRIVGGYALNISDAPYQVSLQRGQHFCGGSIIGKNWIITAAHCTDGQYPNYLTVRVGSSIHNANGKLVKIKRIVQHPNFNYSNIDYDYSLLELSEPLIFNNTCQPVALPHFFDFIRDNTKCFVTGWGNTQNSSESRLVLRGAEVPIVNQKKCAQAYNRYGGVTPRMICAGLEEGGKDACQGDSGGPLVCRKKLFGIVSWGYGCAQPNYPGIYSRVTAARSWIRKVSGI